MTYVSTVRLSRDTTAEYMAAVWQGPVPGDLVLHHWIRVGAGDPPEMLMVWDGGPEAAAWVSDLFGEFGDITTRDGRDSTQGLATCLARDLQGFAEYLRHLGTAEAEIESQLEVRRRGMTAATRSAAVQSGRAWFEQRLAQSAPEA
jgi:hypothetical protein